MEEDIITLKLTPQEYHYLQHGMKHAIKHTKHYGDKELEKIYKSVRDNIMTQAKEQRRAKWEKEHDC